MLPHSRQEAYVVAMMVRDRKYIDRLSLILGEVERLMDRSVPEQVTDAARLRAAITLLEADRRAEATALIKELSPWAGGISVECGQL